MIYPQLVEYIKNSLAQNIPISQVKKYLLAKGWRVSDIDEAIAITTQNSPQSQSGEMKPAETKKNSDKKPIPPALIFGAVGALVLILIIGFAIYFVTTAPKQISDTEILQGASAVLASGKEAKFNIDGGEHRMVVNSVGTDSASVTIYSTPISKTFSAGQSEKFDLNDDGVYDLLVRLDSITEEKANFYIQKITETICTEDWECVDWGNCLDSLQNRTCTDANSCGTEESKPDEVQSCVVETVLSCADQNGTVCESYEECSETLVNGDCCLGSCARILAIDCDTSISCLINETDTCHPANMTYEIPSSNSTWTQTATYFYSIEGFEDASEEQCEFYSKIKEVTGNFTNSYWTTLQAVPYTDAEIAEMVDDIISGLTDQYGTCSFSTSDLEDYLIKIQDENYELTPQEIIDYQCTGSLYA
ncbi:MAG: hypothetical protein M1416_02705 [Candidatus Pacearchaeota archaeon]|nr:hypothetical protein [Candidatus Pacearchaeota archaeon]